MRRVAEVFLYLALLTASFDIFLVIERGFTVRASQLFLLGAVLMTFLRVVSARRLAIPLGYGYLLAWAGAIVLMVPNSQLQLRGVAYAGLLLFYALVVLTATQLIRCARASKRLLGVYLASFVLVSLFGMLQFTLPLIGLPAPLVQQWWIRGTLARVNGFSFEPSYFATYMLTGWIVLAHLIHSGSRLLRRPYLYLMFATVTAALVLSSSRMGLAMMALYFAYFPLMAGWRALRTRANVRYLIYCLTGFVGAVLILVAILATGTSKLFLAGTGIGGTPSHSTDTRFRELQDTLAVFRQSPLIGYSLGGVAPAIGELRGGPVNSLAEAQNNEGMSVFVEVLAASGVIGFLPFLAYMLVLIVEPLRLARVTVDPEHSRVLTGLAVSFMFLLLILQMNQNILRPYFWLHIAVLSSFYAVAKQKLLTRLALQ